MGPESPSIMGQVESSDASAIDKGKDVAKPQLQDVQAAGASAHTSPSASPPSHQDQSPSSPASTVSHAAEPSLQFFPSIPEANRARVLSGGRLTVGALEGVFGGEKFQISVAGGHVRTPTLKSAGDVTAAPSREPKGGTQAARSAMTEAARAAKEGLPAAAGDVQEKVGEKRKRDDGTSVFLESVRRADIGKVRGAPAAHDASHGTLLPHANWQWQSKPFNPRLLTCVTRLNSSSLHKPLSLPFPIHR